MCYAMPLYCSLSHDLMKLTKSKGSREGNDGVGSLRTESRARPVTSRRLIDRAYSYSAMLYVLAVAAGGDQRNKQPGCYTAA